MHPDPQVPSGFIQRDDRVRNRVGKDLPNSPDDSLHVSRVEVRGPPIATSVAENSLADILIVPSPSQKFA